MTNEAGVHWADLVLLFIVGASALMSLFRGFVREVLALAGWVCASWGAFHYAGRLAPLLDGIVSVPSVRLAMAFLAVLVGVLFGFALLNQLASRLVSSTGLTPTDRLLGMLFGIARGVAIATLLVMLAGLTPVPRDAWWREARLLPHVESLARRAIGWLPPELAAHFDYDQADSKQGARPRARDSFSG